MKYYIYISDTKVDMLFPQVPHDIKRKVATQFGIDIKLFSGGWPTFVFLMLGTTTTEAAAPFAVFERCAFVRRRQRISRRPAKPLARSATRRHPRLFFPSPETRPDCISAG